MKTTEEYLDELVKEAETVQWLGQIIDEDGEMAKSCAKDILRIAEGLRKSLATYVRPLPEPPPAPEGMEWQDIANPYKLHGLNDFPMSIFIDPYTKRPKWEKLHKYSILNPDYVYLKLVTKTTP